MTTGSGTRRPRIGPRPHHAAAVLASVVALATGLTVAAAADSGELDAAATTAGRSSTSSAAAAGTAPGQTSAVGPTASSTAPTEGTPAPKPPPAAIAGTPASQTYAFRPTSLQLPSGVVAAVDPAGVDARGILQVPTEVARVGWWTGGALSDEPFGSVVLAGHVDSATQGLGAMVELLDADIGAEIVVRDQSQEQRYRIVSTTAVPKARLAADAEPFRQDIGHRLVLITCGGDFDDVAGSYTHNVVIVATPIA